VHGIGLFPKTNGRNLLFSAPSYLYVKRQKEGGKKMRRGRRQKTSPEADFCFFSFFYFGHDARCRHLGVWKQH